MQKQHISILSTQQVYGSFDSQQISIDFPLKKYVKIHTIGVQDNQIDYTINQIIQKQNISKIETVITFIGVVMIGFLLAYIGLIFWIIAFLNPFLLVVQLLMLGVYVGETTKAVRMRVLKKQKKKATQFLLQQNMRLYSRKLIKWRLDNDENKIYMKNLRG